MDSVLETTPVEHEDVGTEAQRTNLTNLSRWKSISPGNLL